MRIPIHIVTKYKKAPLFGAERSVLPKPLQVRMTLQEAQILRQLLDQIELGTDELPPFLEITKPLDQLVATTVLSAGVSATEKQVILRLPLSATHNLRLFIQRAHLPSLGAKQVEGILQKIEKSLPKGEDKKTNDGSKPDSLLLIFSPLEGRLLQHLLGQIEISVAEVSAFLTLYIPLEQQVSLGEGEKEIIMKVPEVAGGNLLVFLERARITGQQAKTVYSIIEKVQNSLHQLRSHGDEAVNLVLILSVGCIPWLFPGALLAHDLTADPAAAAGQRPLIELEGQGGIPIINITAPSPEGVSHNIFSAYNVGEKGVVLNNNADQPPDVASLLTQSPLFANAQLAVCSAQLILAEVSGGDKSYLEGLTEIYGPGAAFVLANPHGIYCNGAGFINAHQVTLTTGKPQLDRAGALRAIQVDKGTIEICGRGLNIPLSVDSSHPLTLLSRAVAISGKLSYAGPLEIYNGSNTWNVATKTLLPHPSQGSPVAVHLYQGGDESFKNSEHASNLGSYNAGYNTVTNQVYVSTEKTDISRGSDIQRSLFAEQQRKENKSLNTLSISQQKSISYDRGARAAKMWERFSKSSTKSDSKGLKHWNIQNKSFLKGNNQSISQGQWARSKTAPLSVETRRKQPVSNRHGKSVRMSLWPPWKELGEFSAETLMSNQVGGVGRLADGPLLFNQGKKLGDVLSLVIGGAEIIGGGLIGVGGVSSVAVTGGGSLLIVPAVLAEGVAVKPYQLDANVKAEGGNSSEKSIRNEQGEVVMGGEGGAKEGGKQQERVIIHEQPSQYKHILRNDVGHLDDTPSNRMLLEDVANDASHYLGKDVIGCTWHANTKNKINMDQEQLLTLQEAYYAMLKSLEELYELEVRACLSDMYINTGNGKTMDPAAWGAWLDAVQKVKPQIAIPEEVYMSCEFEYSDYSEEETRKIVQQVKSEPENYVSTDELTRGICYAKTLGDGTQLWKIVYYGKVGHVGIGEVPKSYLLQRAKEQEKTSSFIESTYIPKLTVKEAYHAMLEYLAVLYQINNEVEIREFFGGMQINDKNGKTLDPTVWGAWLDAVQEVNPQIVIPEEAQICCEFQYYTYSKEKVREILEQVTSDTDHYVGKDEKSGSVYYAKIQEDGTHAWKIVRNKKTIHVGIGSLPTFFLPQDREMVVSRKEWRVVESDQAIFASLCQLKENHAYTKAVFPKLEWIRLERLGAGVKPVELLASIDALSAGKEGKSALYAGLGAVEMMPYPIAALRSNKVPKWMRVGMKGGEGVNIAKIPVGRRGNVLRIITKNTPTTIQGTKFTGHALDQMQARGILSPSAVLDVVKNPAGNKPETMQKTYEMILKGDIGRLEIKILKRSNFDSNDYWDSNWLESEISIDIPGFIALYETNLRVDDLQRFYDKLTNIQSGKVKEAELITMENGLYLHCKLSINGIIECKGKANNDTDSFKILSFDRKVGIMKALARLRILYNKNIHSDGKEHVAQQVGRHGRAMTNHTSRKNQQGVIVGSNDWQEEYQGSALFKKNNAALSSRDVTKVKPSIGLLTDRSVFHGGEREDVLMAPLKELGEFRAGTLNALLGNQVGGVGRLADGPLLFNQGKKLGDVLSLVIGGTEIIGGGLIGAGGVSSVAVTGGGSLLIVPAVLAEGVAVKPYQLDANVKAERGNSSEKWIRNEQGEVVMAGERIEPKGNGVKQSKGGNIGRIAQKMSPDEIGDFLEGGNNWHKTSIKADFLKHFRKELKGNTNADFYIDRYTKEILLKGNKTGFSIVGDNFWPEDIIDKIKGSLIVKSSFTPVSKTQFKKPAEAYGYGGITFWHPLSFSLEEHIAAYERTFVEFIEQNYDLFIENAVEELCLYIEAYYDGGQCNFEIFNKDLLQRLSRFNVSIPISVYVLKKRAKDLLKDASMCHQQDCYTYLASLCQLKENQAHTKAVFPKSDCYWLLDFDNVNLLGLNGYASIDALSAGKEGKSALYAGLGAVEMMPYPIAALRSNKVPKWMRVGLKGGEGVKDLKNAGRTLEDLSSLTDAHWKEVKKLIPKDWIQKPLNKGHGIKFVNPHKKGEQILLEKGWSNAKELLHSGSYMKVSRDGKVIRIPLAGNPVLKSI
eukprot:gene1037-1315_t